jgi:6-phosphogluconate dehydrogenase (decarboxylating)
MQLGMVGLGRMGGNMTKRLEAAGDLASLEERERRIVRIRLEEI